MTISKRPLRTLGALSAFSALALVSACNLIIDGSSTSCVDDADCVNFPNFGCNLDLGECETLDKCSSNEACAAAEVCRFPSPRVCVPIRQGDCQELFPDDDTYRDDNTMLIGLTAPLTIEASTGQSIANGAKLAVQEFNDQGGVEGTRKMVLILCDDHAEAQDAYENGLVVANIGAQALIGPAYSGQTIQTAGTSQEPGTVVNNVLLISPSATSTLVTGIEDESPRCIDDCNEDAACIAACPGLVWRSSPSDDFQGAGLAAYFEELEVAVKKRGGVPSRPSITVHVLSKPDAYGQFLAEGIRTRLSFNGAAATTQQGGDPPRFKVAEYEDVDPETDGVQPDPITINASLDAHPDAVFLIGTGEVAEIINTFENDWLSSGGLEEDRPFYILGDGGLSTDVTTAANGASAASRLRGSVPGPVESSIYDAFSGAYGDAFPSAEFPEGGPEIFGAAGAYDIVYMLAFSSMAARGKPLTAEELARGFSKLIEGDPIVPGINGVGPAQSILSGGGTIDFEGASGALQFDLATGEAPSPIQIWCIDPNAGAGDSGINAGVYFDAGVIGGTEEPGALDPPQFACPFNTCDDFNDCTTHPWGPVCLSSGPNMGFCGCTTSIDCDPSTCVASTDRCSP